MTTPTPATTRISGSVMIQGNDVRSIILDTMHSLEHSLPEERENLMLDPETRGTSGVDVVNPQDVEQAIGRWSVDSNITDNVLGDIRRLIQQSYKQNTYLGRHFRYHLENCDLGVSFQCLSTLLVIAHPLANDEDGVQNVELVHIYIHSGAKTLQQKGFYKCCHWCWSRRCCRTCSGPRVMTPGEIYKVQRVISAFQAQWIHEHMPQTVRMWNSKTCRSFRTLTVRCVHDPDTRSTSGIEIINTQRD